MIRGFRQLYTNGDEALFEAACPAILNGIENLTTGPDLGRPCDLSDPALRSHGLRMVPKVRLNRLPRFALWATACATAFWPAGTFLRAYETIAGPRSKP
jgi:hypothetical protein